MSSVIARTRPLMRKHTVIALFILCTITLHELSSHHNLAAANVPISHPRFLSPFLVTLNISFLYLKYFKD
jgi:hypothetical protein